MTPTVAPPFSGLFGRPDAQAALGMYRCRAGVYDWQLAPYEPIREHAIQRLELQRGDTVLDVGCGTGMSLPQLSAAVGPQGRVIAIDQCPEMVEQARARVAALGLKNVDLRCASIEELPSGEQADAALFHFTHDILQTPSALDQVLGRLKIGASVAATGLKWTYPWLVALNALVWVNAMQSVTTLQGLDAPWRHLAERGVDLRLETMVMGTIYVASGVVGRRRA